MGLGTAALVVVLLLASASVWRFEQRPALPAGVHDSRAARAGRTAVLAAERPAPSPPGHPVTDRERLLAKAHRLLGTPYEYGAKGPHAYDCSGFTKAAYAAAGIHLPDGSFNQAEHDRRLTDPAQLRPGDLIFYRWAGKSGISHVTLYAGDGWVIGTGTPGQPSRVVLYPLSADLRRESDELTCRHVRLPDER